MNRTRTAVIIALIIALLGGIAGGVGWWIHTNTPTSTSTTTLPEPQVSTIPEPQVDAPDPEPETVEAPAYVYSNFCNESGVADYPLADGYYVPVDFTTVTEVTAPVEGFSPLSSLEDGKRLLLVAGCDTPTQAPDVTFTALDVDPEPCRNISDTEIRSDCATYALTTPFLATRDPSQTQGPAYPEWFTGQQLYEINIAFGFEPEPSGPTYDVFAAAGTWQMDITYQGQSYSLVLTVPEQF